MCRNIKTLFNFEPPTTQAEIHDACLQFVRKISGSGKPSKINEPAFNNAVETIALDVKLLLDSLVTSAPSRNRTEEIAKAREKAVKRFGT